ncbi:hypothetical protein OESDEN_24831 [Oesophagostomum dentatum]|uniref:Uncharacterized protein n=1 Tax=Oesophagostomum dentatum TaxID=61180 RepID=A0A0B1RR48_OESDE|nr:hypothetical protein OESDEN_24831 [Oesophagostomum dentatum]
MNAYALLVCTILAMCITFGYASELLYRDDSLLYQVHYSSSTDYQSYITAARYNSHPERYLATSAYSS